MNQLKKLAIEQLKERGVKLEELPKLVYELQVHYTPNLKLSVCEKAIDHILEKREVIHAVLTGILLDKIAEKEENRDAIHTLIFEDAPLYGIDEVLALSIVNLYGSIAFTTFGYLDKTKPGIIGEIDKAGGKKDCCNTFLDDILCAIVASAASKIAHKNKEFDQKLS